MRNNIPPMFMQPRFLIIFNESTKMYQVLWAAFITDDPQPNMTVGPFFVTLCSDPVDIRSKDAATLHYTYTCERNHEKVVGDALWNWLRKKYHVQ